MSRAGEMTQWLATLAEDQGLAAGSPIRRLLKTKVWLLAPQSGGFRLPVTAVPGHQRLLVPTGFCPPVAQSHSPRDKHAFLVMFPNIEQNKLYKIQNSVF